MQALAEEVQDSQEKLIKAQKHAEASESKVAALEQQ